MARPLKYYVVYDWGRAVGVCAGHLEARRLKCHWNGMATRLEAEEFAAWWNYDRHEKAAVIRTYGLNTSSPSSPKG